MHHPGDGGRPAESCASPQDPVQSLESISRSSRHFGDHFRATVPRGQEGAVIRGAYGVHHCRSGLQVHYTDAVDLCDMVTGLELKPGLSVQLFLRGTINARLGDRPLFPGQGDGFAPVVEPRALVTARTRPERLERRGLAGTHVRKVSVTISPEWLEDSAAAALGGGWDEIERFARRHLAQRAWIPSREITALGEAILGLSPESGAIRHLQLESRVLDLLAQVFSLLTGSPPQRPARRLDARTLRRLGMVEDLLAGSAPGAVSLAELARLAGVSVSTLQRLCQEVHGMSAAEYIRRRTLHRARVALEREGVSVKEAAFLAGYSNAANFATAFRRAFGCRPTDSRQGRA